MASPLPFPSLSSSPNFKQQQQGTSGLRGHKVKSGSLTIRRTKPAPRLCKVSTQDFTIEEDDVLLTFLKERELNGDLIAKVSDRLWMRKSIKIDNIEADLRNDANQLDEPFDDENPGGFLKLTATNEWLLGENTAPINKKMRAKQQRDNSERRTRLNLLQYEAIKRELFYLTVGIGSACSIYCLTVFSIQAAVSYATGVLFRGCGMALSSPRLVIPAAIYGLWGLSQHFANDFFQLTPAMVGVFAYKAAALVQVYRDNEDLQLILPGNEED